MIIAVDMYSEDVYLAGNIADAEDWLRKQAGDMYETDEACISMIIDVDVEKFYYYKMMPPVSRLERITQ